MKTNKLTAMALLAALSVILVYLIHFPIFPTAPFLEYDPADIPLMIAAFVFGPVPALLVCVVTCAIQAFTVSAGSGVIGLCMHLFSTGAFILTAGFTAGKADTLKKTIIGLAAGVAVATLLMIPLNLIFTPMYGTPIQAVKQMMLPVIVPFNLIKFTLNALLTFLVYNAVRKYIHK